MSEIKVALVESSNGALRALAEILKKNGIKAVSCTGGSTALGEIAQNGADVLVISEQLVDMSGYQLAGLLKSADITNSLPIIIVAQTTESSKDFWFKASFADAVILAKDLKQDKTVELIKQLAELSVAANVKASIIENSSLIVGTAPAPDSKNITENLLEELLIERMVGHFIRSIVESASNRKEFSRRLFYFMDKVCEPDLSGFIVNNPAQPWSIYQSANIDQDARQSLVNNAKELLEIKDSIAQQIYEDELSDKKAKIQKAKILLVSSANGTKFGAIILGWSSDRKIERRLKLALEHLKVQIAPVMQLMIASDRNNRIPVEAQSWSSTDQLTGLYNMEFFMGFLQQQLLFSLRQKLPVGLCLIDIDRLPELNQKWGSELNDAVLKPLASKIAQSTRASDLVARYGTDQVAVVLPNTDIKGAKVLGDKLRKEIANMNFGNGEEQKVTISVGCAQFKFDDPVPESILKDAKIALAKAKDSDNQVSD